MGLFIPLGWSQLPVPHAPWPRENPRIDLRKLSLTPSGYPGFQCSAEGANPFPPPWDLGWAERR